MTDVRPIAGVALEQQPERVLLRLLGCGEARGEQDQGGTLEARAMAGVMWVAYNRRQRKRWASKTLGQVILQPWQFSCFNPTDPNRPKLLQLYDTDLASWERADTVADLIEAGWLPDPTAGATHYCRAELWGTPTPVGQRVRWHDQVEIDAGRTRETVTIGSHVFGVAP